MPTPALRFEEPSFREGLASYVAATCSRFRVRRADVEDLVQEVLATVVASMNSFRNEKGEFDAWARGVALNVIRRHSRNSKRYAARFCEYRSNVEDCATPEPSPEWCARRTEARGALANAAENLSEQQAQVLVLYVVDDMTHGDIGRELQISESASQKCYQRARNHLAQCLEMDLLSVMPPFLTSCDEPVSFNKADSRWSEWSHYAAQFAAVTVAVLLTSAPKSSTSFDSSTCEARVLASVNNAVMSRSDEPQVLRDTPTGKPEPAYLPSVAAVPAPTRAKDKRTYVQDLAPLPPFKPKPSALDHRLRGR